VHASGSDILQGSGRAATETREVAAFTGIDLAGSNELIVRVGGERRVVVHADDNLLGHITTDVQAGVLVVGNMPGSIETKSRTYVEIDVPSVDTLALSGSGVVTVTGVEASGLAVRLPGSGLLRASGRATALDVELGGSGDAQLRELTAADVSASVSGSGRIVVTATNRLDATVSGSGAVVYGGEPPHLATSVTGTGAVLPG